MNNHGLKPVRGNIYMTGHGLVIVIDENKHGIQWISAGHTRTGGTTPLVTTTTTVRKWDNKTETIEKLGVDQWQKMGDTLQDYIQKSLLKNFGF